MGAQSTRAGRQSFPSTAPWPRAGLSLQAASCQQAHIHLGTPPGPTQHLLGGQTGPSCLLLLWVQLAQALLGLLFVLWDPESHRYKKSVGLSRYLPFPHSKRSPELCPGQTSTSSSWVPTSSLGDRCTQGGGTPTPVSLCTGVQGEWDKWD